MSPTSAGPGPTGTVGGGLPLSTVAVDPARQVAGAALIVVGARVGAGVLVGVVWSLISPTVTCTAVGADCQYSFESGRFFIGEGFYAALAAAGGLVAATAFRRWIRELGAPIVVALAIGGLAASVVAWRIGVYLGPGDPGAQTLAVGAVAELPLRLRSSGLLLGWPIAAVAAALVISTLSDDDRPADRELRAPPDPAELAAWIQSQDSAGSTR